MAEKQTRRSISVNRKLYEQAKDVAKVRGVALSAFTERALHVAIADADGTPPWCVVGATVDYSSVIGESPVVRGATIRNGPEKLDSGEWVVWLAGGGGKLPSCGVSVLALRPSSQSAGSAQGREGRARRATAKRS